MAFIYIKHSGEMKEWNGGLGGYTKKPKRLSQSSPIGRKALKFAMQIRYVKSFTSSTGTVAKFILHSIIYLFH